MHHVLICFFYSKEGKKVSIRTTSARWYTRRGFVLKKVIRFSSDPASSTLTLHEKQPSNIEHQMLLAVFLVNRVKQKL